MKIDCIYYGIWYISYDVRYKTRRTKHVKVIAETESCYNRISVFKNVIYHLLDLRGQDFLRKETKPLFKPIPYF